MKKIVASVGLVALGASSIETASAQVLGAPDSSKPWSVSATLRGFYDDNTTTIPNGQALPPGVKRDSFGWEVSPSAALKWSVDQTTLNLGFLYSFKYYNDKPIGNSVHSEQTFTFNAGLEHSFTERYKARVNDSFVIGQEPDLLRAGNTFSTFQYVSGDNIRNNGSIAFDGQITPDFGIGLGYDNAFYDYKDRGFTTTGGGLFPAVVPSLAGILNRIENRAHVEGLYQVLPDTKALIGYQFTDLDYNANEPIAGNVFFGTFLLPTAMSDSRNYREHSGYVGLEHNFTPDLTGSIRGGVSYTEYYNANGSDSPVSPYVDATLKYTYAPQSYAEVGFSYDRAPTDVLANSGTAAITPNGSSITLDAESAVAFASVTHQITPSLFGTLMGQFQNNDYRGGLADGKTEQFYLFGLDFEYRFNQYLSAHAGYNYDNLGSELGRHFDRNRVYIGVTATY